jgi:hypothetical protein
MFAGVSEKPSDSIFMMEDMLSKEGTGNKQQTELS